MKNKILEIILLIFAIFLVLALAEILLKGIFVLVILLFLRTLYLQNKNNPNQKKFIAGIIPAVKPDAFYSGAVGNWKFSWIGKKFDAAAQSGMNVFEKNGTRTEAWPFTTSTGKGLYDKQLEVIKIDYHKPENPIWLRPVLDEIVEVLPGEYLGKTLLRIIPGYPFLLTYFTLKKA